MNARITALVIVLILLVAGGAAFVLTRSQPPVARDETATTTPAAEGQPSATTTAPTPEKESDTAALNQRIYKFGVHITPLEVVSDSRCPMGVYCIQAGEVVVKVKLEDGTHSEVVTMHQGSPIAFGNKHVTLMSATPPKSQHGTIQPSDYRFTFSVAYGMGGDAP